MRFARACGIALLPDASGTHLLSARLRAGSRDSARSSESRSRTQHLAGVDGSRRGRGHGVFMPGIGQRSPGSLGGPEGCRELVSEPSAVAAGVPAAPLAQGAIGGGGGEGPGGRGGGGGGGG